VVIRISALKWKGSWYTTH